MVKHFEKSIEVIDPMGTPIHVCPDCVDHPRMREPKRGYDCKNTFDTKEGYTGQCCCYSCKHT